MRWLFSPALDVDLAFVLQVAATQIYLYGRPAVHAARFFPLPVNSLVPLSALPLESLGLHHLGHGPGAFLVLDSWPLLRQLEWHAPADLCKLVAELVLVLASLPQLEVLRLKGLSKRDDKEARDVTLGLARASLQHCPLLRELHVEDEEEMCRMSEARARALAKSLWRLDLELHIFA